jgi:hypothetical protein
MAMFAIRTASGSMVGLIRAQDGAPPSGVSGEPGFTVTPVDLDEHSIAIAGTDAEERIHQTYERLRAAETSGNG